jgi:hypothetical protein
MDKISKILFSLAIVLAIGFLFFIGIGIVKGGVIDDFESFDTYMLGYMPTSTNPGIWIQRHTFPNDNRSWSVVGDAGCYASEQCITDTGGDYDLGYVRFSSTTTLPAIDSGYIWFRIKPVRTGTVGTDQFYIHCNSADGYQIKVSINRGQEDTGVVKVYEAFAAGPETYEVMVLDTLTATEMDQGYSYLGITWVGSDKFKVDLQPYNDSHTTTTDWHTASTTIEWNDIGEWKFYSANEASGMRIDSILLSGWEEECNLYDNYIDCVANENCMWVSAYPPYCTTWEVEAECAEGGYTCHYCTYEECTGMDYCYWVGDEDVGYCRYGTTSATSTFDTWEDFDLEQLKNPKAFFNWLQGTFNPINKPPISWIVDIYNIINGIDISEYTASTSIWSTTSNFGKVEIASSTFFPAMTFSFIDFGTLKEKYGTQFGMLKTILIFSLWLSFIFVIFRLSKELINAITGQKVAEDTEEKI